MRKGCPYRRSQSGGYHFHFQRFVVGLVVGMVLVVVLSWCFGRKQQRVEGEGPGWWRDSSFVFVEFVRGSVDSLQGDLCLVFEEWFKEWKSVLMIER
jgi:hypothetical protein